MLIWFFYEEIGFRSQFYTTSSLLEERSRLHTGGKALGECSAGLLEVEDLHPEVVFRTLRSGSGCSL